MAKDIEDVQFNIRAVDGATAVLKNVNGALQTVEKSWGSFSKMVGGSAIAAAAGGAVVGVFGQMVREMREAETIGLRFNAMLRATGNTAGYTARELDQMAEAIADNSMFDDEAVKAGMTNLIKFGNIQRDVFRQAIQLSADYAATTGRDMASASQDIGRGLQSPTEGIKALKRELGTLAPEQERSIKLFMEQGRMAEAQGVVLQWMQSRLQGTAREMNSGLNGAIQTVNKNWGDMLKAMGRGRVEEGANLFLNKLAGELKSIQRIFESNDWMERARIFFGELTIFGSRGMGLVDGSSSGRVATGQIRGLPAPKLPRTAEQIEAAKRAEEARLRGLKEAAELQKRWAAESSRDAERQAELQLRFVGEQWAARQKLIEEDREAIYRSMDIRFEAEQELQREIGQMNLRAYHERERKIQQANEDMRKYNLEAEKRLLEEENQFAIQAARNLQSEMSSLVYDVLDRRTDSLGERFSQMLKRMQAELIASQLNKFLFGDFGRSGDVGGVAGRLINGGLNALFGSPGYPEDEFASGGQFTVPGVGGTDSRVIKFRATPGERVTIQTPQQQRAGAGGGVTVNLNFALGVTQTVRAEIAALMPQITQAATAGVYEARSRLPAGSQP